MGVVVADCRECIHLKANIEKLICGECDKELSVEVIAEGYCFYFKKKQPVSCEKIDIPMKDKIIDTCEDIKNLLIKKNTDYGDSFSQTMDKYGDAALLLRLEDKFNRLERLYKSKEQNVEDESFKDTIMDTAGYCLLWLAYRSGKE